MLKIDVITHTFIGYVGVIILPETLNSRSISYWDPWLNTNWQHGYGGYWYNILIKYYDFNKQK